MARDIVQAIEVNAEPKTVFDTVASREGLAAFWTSDVEGDDRPGGELSFGFPHAPSRLPITIATVDAPSAIRWECSSDWPFWNGTTVEWAFEPSEHGTQVVLRHLGYADDMPDFAFGSVNLTWALVTSRLKDVVESGGAPNPALG
ncbi:MAG TPA: SRPBCC domain-containing protein [Actinomycetota bacterium]